MGLLDDAIREHLELKRRHGADPGEVERQEREALGAARREEAAAAEGEPATGVAEPAETAEPPEFELPPEGDEDVEPADDALREPEESADALRDPAPETREYSRPPADELPPSEPGIAETPDRGHEAAAPGYDEDPWLDEDPDEVPAEESLDRSPEQDNEDVLEETPDFLQETPEHDRLWFEQRPPRDFDWDK